MYEIFLLLKSKSNGILESFIWYALHFITRKFVFSIWGDFMLVFVVCDIFRQ